MAASRHSRAPKAQLPALEAGPVRLSVIREQARKHLLDAIDSKRGKKALVLDPTISGPLSLLDANLSEVLSEHGVIKVLYLERKLLDDPAYNQGEPRLIDTRTITYIVRATVENAQLVAAQIKAVATSGTHDFAVFFVPRRTTACDKVLEEAGVLADATRGELPLDAFPLDDDVLSMELPSAFRDCVLDGDTSPLYHTARALTQLQRHFGLVPRIQGKGLAAESVRKILLQMRRDGQATTSSHAAPKIHRMVLIDRDIDTATPMCTQITLEGLVDEVAGIKCGTVPWTARERQGHSSDGGASSSGASTSSAAGSRGAKGSIMLNSSDPYWQEFRDLPYYIASHRLQQYAREARKEYSELGSKDISDLKMFVKGLPRVMLLDRISDVAAPVAEVVKQQLFHDRLRHEQDILDNYELEESVDFVQELMCRGAGVVEVLRLLVLMGIANNGLPRRHFDTLRSQLLQTYGHHQLPTLTSLEKCGLLKVQTGGKGAWATIRKSFNLIVSDDEQQPTAGQAPTSIAHLYKGYAPLSIRFLEHALKASWAAVSEGLFLLAPVTHFDVWQATDDHGAPVEKPYKSSAAAMGGLVTVAGAPGGGGGGAAGSGSGGPQAGANGAAANGADAAGTRQEVVAVVFIGGATFSEISALRLLSTLPGYQQYRFLAVTTSIVNGRTLLGTFADPTLQGFAD